LCAVAEEGFLTLFSVFADVTSLARPRAFDTLEAVGRAYLDFAVSNPALYRLMFGHELTQEERTPALGQAAEGAFSFLVSTVELSQKQGLARPDSSMALANLLWAMMHGLACLVIDGQLQTEDSEEGLPTLLTAKRIDLSADASRILDLMVEVLTVGLAPVPSD
jgi:AcrR family transcriptional regulator